MFLIKKKRIICKISGNTHTFLAHYYPYTLCNHSITTIPEDQNCSVSSLPYPSSTSFKSPFGTYLNQNPPPLSHTTIQQNSCSNLLVPAIAPSYTVIAIRISNPQTSHPRHRLQPEDRVRPRLIARFLLLSRARAILHRSSSPFFARFDPCVIHQTSSVALRQTSAPRHEAYETRTNVDLTRFSVRRFVVFTTAVAAAQTLLGARR